ncbi:protein kinase domain-containing protein [Streptomyces beigongshangae]|uniref:protein kinase domain-containing protein n=1 Tax=Streptomyces beigongshangae TaxID=2841597 RepID=UPI001C84A93C|nr:DUF4328 domain-containing protein [Streptomyces sp. REN17]
MDGLAPDDPGWIGNYRLLGRLGEGGMGRVYLARSDRGRTVAVKVVQEQLARKPDFRRRFAQEVKAAQRVGGEWTAPVLDADTEAATPWVATGYVAGPSLAEVVDKQYGPLPPKSVRALATGLVRALQAIHGAGLVHRDLKPSNVLVTIDGPRVIDFGIARALDPSMESGDGLTLTGVVVGSPGFMSPEQVRGERVTYASDVFCLGAVLAYTATGRMPFGAGEGGIHSLLFRIAGEEPDLTGIPEPWDRLIAWCLVKDPARRPSLDDLSQHIEGIEGAEGAGGVGGAGGIRGTGGAWLPGEVLAELGRHAVQLLDIENPQNAQDRQDPQDPRSAQDPRSRALAGQTPAAASPHTPAHTPAHAPVQGFGPPLAYAPSPPPWQSPPPGGLHPGGLQPSVLHAGSPPPAGRLTPPGRGAFSAPPARPARALATALALLLGLYILPLLFRSAVLGEAYLLLDARDSMSATRDVNGFEELKFATDLADSIELLVGLAVVVVWPIWFQRVRHNAEAFEPGQLRYASGMAAGSWFVPLVNLIMPKQISNDIWTASTGHRVGAGRWILHLWWWSFVAYAVMYFSDSWSSWYDSDIVVEATDDIVTGLVTNVLGVVSAVLAVLVVRRLTTVQQARIQEARNAGTA